MIFRSKTGEKRFELFVICDELCKLSNSDMYPFHMPGHKRNKKFMDLTSIADMDITEIDGFDDLHHAQGIIRAAQERAAALTGAQRTWFLVNGSTCGLLAAVSACTRWGGRILAARNCHKSVYNAIELCGLNPVYMYPGLHETYGIYDGIAPAEVERLLEKYPDVQAVILTSPTYEGVISDIKAIACIAHRHGVPLIVDEAHGAHLGYSPWFEPSAVSLGADLIIQSLHKTLPSMTQTAVLHKCGSMVDEARVQKYLSMYQSSSPSYVMMAGMDRCMALLENQGQQLFEDYYRRLSGLRHSLINLRNIRLLDGKDVCRAEGSRYDCSKLVFYIRSLSEPGVAGSKGMGPWLYEQLREKYHLQMEMCSADYVIAMTSFCDTEEGFERLRKAVTELDGAYDRLCGAAVQDAGRSQSAAASGEVMAMQESSGALQPRIPMAGTEVPYMNSFEAGLRDMELINREDALGRISGDYLYVYPPGVPFSVPGEIIDKNVLELMDLYFHCGLEIRSGADGAPERLRVLV